MAMVLKTIDRAADTLYKGFVSEAFGWRGAVLFFVLLGGLMPFASLVNALWAGLILFVSCGHADLALSPAAFYTLCAGLFCIGVLGVWIDIKKMAARPVVNRHTPP